VTWIALPARHLDLQSFDSEAWAGDSGFRTSDSSGGFVADYRDPTCPQGDPNRNDLRSFDSGLPESDSLLAYRIHDSPLPIQNPKQTIP
jgi:hypothetical protein